jgi:tyrosyl-tRNA synthetase
VARLKGHGEFRVERDRDGLEPLVYTDINQMNEDYTNDIVCRSRVFFYSSPVSLLTIYQLTPQLLKPAVAKALIELTAPIQVAYQASREWQEISSRAYPPPPKKEKKVKNKGTRYPGAKEEGAPKQGDTQTVVVGL